MTEIRFIPQGPDLSLESRSKHPVFFDVLMRVDPDKDSREAIEEWCSLLEEQSKRLRVALSDPNFLKNKKWKDVAPNLDPSG